MLIPELETAVRHGSDEWRSAALRRITDLYLQDSGRLTEDQIRLFDDVFVTLITDIDTKARTELSRQLAPVANAPRMTVRRLAKDDDIVVAASVLTQSSGLATDDLVEIANSASAEHLHAIATRAEIDEAVTDVLVRRGDFTVKRTLACNAGARISESTFTALMRSSQYDGMLAEAVALRDDVPNHIFRELLSRASEAVRQRLLARARPETRAEIRRVLASPSDEPVARPARDFSDAQARISARAEAGQLHEQDLSDFARTQAYDDTVAGLSQLTGVPVDVVDRLMCGDRPDPILILCKAVGYSWPTARNIILARQRNKPPAAVDAVSKDFDRLLPSTAQRVLKFWQITPASLRAAS